MSAPPTPARPSTASTSTSATSTPVPNAAAHPRSSAAAHRAPEPAFAPAESLDADTLRTFIERLAAEDEREDGPRSPERLRERAWAMHCEGNRSPAIARELDVPERTVRHWIATTRDELAAELGDWRSHQLLVTLDALNQAPAAAWDGFHDERAIDRALMHPALDGAEGFGGPAAAEKGRPRTPLWQRKSGAPRYLGLVVTIQKELIRLLDLRSEAAAAIPSARATHETATPATSATLADANAPASPDAPGAPAIVAPTPLTPAAHDEPRSPSDENAATAATAATASASQPAPASHPSWGRRPAGQAQPRAHVENPAAPAVIARAERLNLLPERPTAADRAMLREFDRLMTRCENAAKSATPSAAGPATRRPGAAATPATASALRKPQPLAAAS